MCAAWRQGKFCERKSESCTQHVDPEPPSRAHPVSGAFLKMATGDRRHRSTSGGPADLGALELLAAAGSNQLC